MPRKTKSVVVVKGFDVKEFKSLTEAAKFLGCSLSFASWGVQTTLLVKGARIYTKEEYYGFDKINTRNK